MNLVTKRLTEQTIREVQLQGGSFDYKQGAFDFSGPANEDKTLLYRLTGLVRNANTQIDFSKDDRIFISGAVTWRPTDATDLTLYSHYQKDSYNWNYGVPVLGSALPNPKAEFRIRVLWESLDTQGISPSRLGLDITLNTSSPTVLNSGRIFFM